MKIHFLLLTIFFRSEIFFSGVISTPKLFNKNIHLITGLVFTKDLSNDLLIGGFYKFQLDKSFFCQVITEYFLKEKFFLISLKTEHGNFSFKIGISSRKKVWISFGVLFRNINITIGQKTERVDVINKTRCIKKDFNKHGRGGSFFPDEQLPNELFDEQSTHSAADSFSLISSLDNNLLIDSGNDSNITKIDKFNDTKKTKVLVPDFLSSKNLNFVEELEENNLEEEQLGLLADILFLKKNILLGEDFSNLNEKVCEIYIKNNESILSQLKAKGESIQATKAFLLHKNFNSDSIVDVSINLYPSLNKPDQKASYSYLLDKLRRNFCYRVESFCNGKTNKIISSESKSFENENNKEIYFRNNHENEKIQLLLSLANKIKANGYKSYEPKGQIKMDLYAFKILDLAKDNIKITPEKLKENSLNIVVQRLTKGNLNLSEEKIEREKNKISQSIEKRSLDIIIQRLEKKYLDMVNERLKKGNIKITKEILEKEYISIINENLENNMLEEELEKQKQKFNVESFNLSDLFQIQKGYFRNNGELLSILNLDYFEFNEFEKKLEEKANKDVLAKQWFAEFISLRDKKKFLVRVVNMCSNLLILNELYEHQNKLVDEKKHDELFILCPDLCSYSFESSMFLDMDNNLFDKFKSVFSNSYGFNSESRKQSVEEKSTRDRFKCLHLYFAAYKLLTQKYKRKKNKGVVKSENASLESLNEMHSLVDPNQLDRNVKNERSKTAVFSKDVKRFTEEISTTIVDGKFNRKSVPNDYKKTFLYRSEKIARNIKIYIQRNKCFLFQKSCEYNGFEIDDLLFNFRRKINFFEDDTLNTNEVATSYVKFYFHNIYLNSIKRIEETRTEIFSVLQKKDKNQKSILEELKRIDKLTKRTINILKRERKGAVKFYGRKDIGLCADEYLENMKYIQNRVSIIKNLLSVPVETEEFAKNSLIVLNLIIYPEMFEFATDWPFAMEKHKKQEARDLFSYLDGIESVRKGKMTSKLEEILEKQKNQELNFLYSLRAKGLLVANFSEYQKSKLCLDDKLYKNFERYNDLMQIISTKQKIINLIKNNKNTSQFIKDKLLSFDGSYNSLLEISEYCIAFEVLHEDINQLLYYMRVNDHKNINEIKKESIEKIIGALKDEEKLYEDKDQNNRKKNKEKMHIKMNLFFTNQEKFLKTVLFKPLNDFLDMNTIDKLEKSLNTKLLEHRLDENIMKNFILMLEDIEKYSVFSEFLVELKGYNNYIVKRNEWKKANKKLEENIDDQNEIINIARNKSMQALKNYFKKNKIKPVF